LHFVWTCKRYLGHLLYVQNIWMSKICKINANMCCTRVHVIQFCFRCHCKGRVSCNLLCVSCNLLSFCGSNGRRKLQRDLRVVFLDSPYSKPYFISPISPKSVKLMRFSGKSMQFICQNGGHLEKLAAILDLWWPAYFSKK